MLLKRMIMSKFIVIALLILGLSLQGCVHKIVTVPVKIAYGATKGVVKGTSKAVKTIVTGDSKSKKDNNE